MNQIEKYFSGEKLQCSIGVLISVAFIVMAISFFRTENPLLKGLATPTLIISFLLFVVCISIVIRTPKDLERVSAFEKNDPSKLEIVEKPRMEKVIANFKTLKKIELAVLGLGLLVFFLSKENLFWKGVGQGLVIQAVVLFTFDTFAEKRGHIYLHFLHGN